MDIPCPRCGEPWDIDSIHDAADETGSTFDKVRRDFQIRGCAALIGQPEGTTCARDGLAATRHDLADALGDDIDGFAAMVDDARSSIPGLIR